jgi:hypothetical protein
MQQIKNKIPFGRIIFTKELIVSIFLFTILPCAYGQEKISEKVAETKSAVAQGNANIDQANSKSNKIKAFITDSIPTYTDEFGNYLKSFLEYQNKLDYLDGVNNIKTKRKPANKAQRIIDLESKIAKPSMTDKEWTGTQITPYNESKRRKSMSKEIYGFHGFWEGNKFEKYDLNALTRIGYIGYDINPKTGGYSNIHNWRNTHLHKRAAQYDVDVDIVANLRGSKNIHEFLYQAGSDKAWNAFSDSIIELLNEQNAAGVVIDFYQMAAADNPRFIEFLRVIRFKLNEASPRFELSLALPPIDYEKAYHLKENYSLVDRFLIYAFDYNNFAGDNCSSTAPLVSSNADQLSIDKTFNNYISLGIKPENMVIVAGLYGQQWAMTNANPYNQNSKYAKTISFFDFEEDYSVRIKPVLDNNVLQNYISFSDNNGNWFITWGENIVSLSLKCDYINNKNVKGIGFWQLGNTVSGDLNTQKFWPLIYKKFALPEATMPQDITANFDEIPTSNIDSILSVNQALIMSAVNLAENPFLPDKPDRSQLAKIGSSDYQYKEVIRAIGMFFTILTICAVVALVIAMFDEKVRMLLFFDQAFLFLIPGIMLTITITMRLLGIIWNSEMEFIVGGIVGIGCHFLIQNYFTKKSQLNDETP